jgi:predicted extracellular nuclease
MPSQLRIATFNVENLDDKPDSDPTLAERTVIMRPQFERLRADVLCLQEVHGQEHQGAPRDLSALVELLNATSYQNFNMEYTKTSNDEAYDVRNLVVMSRFQLRDSQKIKHDLVHKPMYRKIMSQPPETVAKEISWERPIFYVKVDLGGNRTLHVINVHMKSKIPTNIDGQKINNYTWRSAAGWAEGSFISSMKRVGQALEVRVKIDEIFDAEGNDAMIVVCGDFNADFDTVPVRAIRGPIEETGNPELCARVMVPCELTIPEPSRFSLLHLGSREMLDHILVSRSMLQYYRGAEIHNEILPDESGAFRTDRKFPESDHAPIVAHFELS